MESIFRNTMADMNWKEIEELAHKDIPVLFPLGVMEEHGPHLPLATDIYFSYAVCKKIKDEVEKRNAKCLIAPPFYWGINHCTGGFPGSFSLKEETMKSVLEDIFENLNQFGFRRIYCINQHGDPLHINAILEAIQASNIAQNMFIKLLIEPFELSNFHLTGKEEYILLDKAEYPNLLIEDSGLLDIHAGAYETAAMKYFYEKMVIPESIKDLEDYSLNYETLEKWMQGGASAKSVVPLGYAGDPAQYEKMIPTVTDMFSILCSFVAEEILKDINSILC
jgi:creatinine amidohydrolase